MFGEFLVTRKRSGGVPGYEGPAPKGVVGRVDARDWPMKASCRGILGDGGACMELCGGGSSRDGVMAGV